MKRYLHLVLYLPLAGVLVFASYHYARTGIMHVEAQQAVHARPYVADYWVTSYTQNLKGEVIEKRHVARFSNGTTVTAKQFFGDGPEIKPYREILMPDGRRLYVNDSAGVRTTFYLSNQELARWKNELASTAKSQTSCGNEGEVSLGTAALLGYNTQIWRLSNIANNGSTNQMTWYRAPELGCLELKQEFANVGVDHKPKIELVTQAQSITPSEPAASELDIGQSYPEVLPSVFEKKTQKLAAMLDEMSNTDACATRMCAPVKEARRDWTRQDKDYKNRLTAAGGK